ncbi:MAG: hypothetical protein MUF42_05740 [Cytophagaceae bacterium]|nr:hypothetical protein [Cytophagaceae bacterium]
MHIVREKIELRSLLLALLMLPAFAYAQNKKPKFTEVKVSGYFRNYVTYRNMLVNYSSPNPSAPNGPLTPRTLMINGLYRNIDDITQSTGYREPLMMIVFNGKPSANSSFDVDFLLDNQLTGELMNGTVKTPPNPRPISVDSNAGALEFPRRIQSARWLNLGGEVNTPYGNFEIKAGGVLNLNLSASTLNFYQYRDDMFERFPWEWQTNSFKRYNAYYNDETLIRDPRLASSSLQGVVFKASQLPLRTGFLIAYGKANNTNIYRSFLENNNQDILGLQVNKKFSTHSIALNFYQSKVILEPESFSRNFRNVALEEVATSELNFNFKGVSISAEGGAGYVSNPIDSALSWDPLLITRISTDKNLLPVPLMLQFYHIGANVVNPNSAILNTSNRNVQATFGSELLYNNNIFEGAVTEFGQMPNNRQGINLSGSLEASKTFRFMLALSSQQEIQNIFDTITFQHRLNGFTRSQFVYYRNQVGPYNRHMTNWRRSWEKISITDSTSNYKKGFNLIDFSVKARTSFLGKELLLMNYINYNSVQDRFSPIALFTNKAFLRSFYEEFMLFYHVHNKLTLVGMLGLERNLGNARTELAPNGKAIDQTGEGYGLGIDYDISSTTGLYFRQRWFNFSDKNFVLDKFRGFDSTVELKIFF